jgi:GT2 family glycosyltransferase
MVVGLLLEARDSVRELRMVLMFMVGFFPKISVIILTYNRPINDVVKCIRAVRSMLYPNFETILVDNSTGSPSKFRELVMEDVRLIDTGQVNLGASGGRNIGIKNSTGDFFFFVDDDVIVDKNSLVELLRVFRENPSIGIVGPMMYFYDDPRKMWFYDTYVEKTPKKDLAEVPLIPGGALFTSRKVLEEIGLFDESYFVYHEDWDLCYRAQKAGYKIMCAIRVNSWHKVESYELKILFVPKMAYYWHRNLFIFAGRNKRTTNGVVSFLLRNLIYYGGKSFPIFFVAIAIRRKKFDTVKAYCHGVLDGLVCLGKLMSSN